MLSTFMIKQRLYAGRQRAEVLITFNAHNLIGYIRWVLPRFRITAVCHARIRWCFLAYSFILQNWDVLQD